MRSTAWRATLAAVVAGLGLFGCTPPPPYVCQSNVQCVDESGVQGLCEANGACAFSDVSCAGSGMRYGDGAGSLSSSCVAAQNACIKDISLGIDFACALKNDGTVWCWGANDTGQLGDGTTTDRATPQAVSGLTDVAAISAAEMHACALKQDSTVWCWGINDQEQLGQCAPPAMSTTPLEVPSFALAGTQATCQGEPFKASILTSGGEHNCAIGLDAQLYCWGENTTGAQGGQAGQDPTTFPMVPGPLPISGGFAGATKVRSGDEYSCALKNDNSVWCWGANDLDELGNGGGNDSFVASNVSGFSDTVSLVLDDETGCSLTNDGSLWCWGNGSTGIFSGTDLSNRGKPVLITTATAAYAGSTAETLCLVQADAQLQCWGASGKGQTGTGTMNATVGAPTRVPLVNVTTAAIGQDNVCALTQDNTLWCWGDNARGQLGPGPAASQPEPTPVRVDFPCP